MKKKIINPPDKQITELALRLNQCWVFEKWPTVIPMLREFTLIQRRETAKEICRLIIKRMQKFASTPLNQRKNAFDELSDLEQQIYHLIRNA